jgi:hypothetical protein
MPRKAKPPIKNMGASVRSRLLNLSKERRQPFQLLLTHYVLERLLYRLSQTKHRDRFILKGPLLLTKWFDDPSRPTRDVDFLGFGSDDETEMINIFREVCAVSCNDGVVLDVDSVSVVRIRERNGIRRPADYREGHGRRRSNAERGASAAKVKAATGPRPS